MTEQRGGVFAQRHGMAPIYRRAFLSLMSSAVGQFAFAAPGKSAPKSVLLIRHAEEPERESSEHLNERGQARAKALPTLFPRRFPRPDAIFAARSSKQSHRAVETVSPLAMALGIPIDDHFPDGQYAGLAKELLSNPVYAGKVVLVCWHRETLPELALALGAHDGGLRWSGSVFDRVWWIRFEGGRARLDQTGQQLLPGDA